MNKRDEHFVFVDVTETVDSESEDESLVSVKKEVLKTAPHQFKL